LPDGERLRSQWLKLGILRRILTILWCKRKKPEALSREMAEEAGFFRLLAEGNSRRKEIG